MRQIGARTDDGWRMAKKFTYRDSDDRLVRTETGTVPDAANTVLTVTRRADLSYDRSGPSTGLGLVPPCPSR